MRRYLPTLLLCGMLAAVCTSCEEINHTDPDHDTTKLWPAYDSASEKWGYINEKGKMAIAAQYDEANGFSCGYACVRKDGQIHYINPDGAVLFSTAENNDHDLNYYLYGHDFYYDYVVVQQGEKYGLMNNKFEYVIQPRYSYIGDMSSNGLVVVREYSEEDNKTNPPRYGYRNTKGEITIPCQYSCASPFIDGYAIVHNGGYWYDYMVGSNCGVINTSGEYVIQQNTYYLQYVGGDMFAFRRLNDSGMGLLSAKGEILSNPAAKVNYKPAVDNELIGVSNTQRKYGYMDFGRNMKIDYQFDYVMPFYEGYAFVEVEEGDEDIVKVIDTKGKVVYTLPKWSEPETGFHNGLALIVVEGDDDYRCRYITPKGETVYEWIEPEVLDCAPVRRLAERYAGNETLNPSMEADMMNTIEEFTAQTKHFSSARHGRRYAHKCDPYED